MSHYVVEQVAKEREPFGDYEYRILRRGRLVARYWHDYRGDEHRLELVTGARESWPVGRMVDFLSGGGPEPLVLSKAAEAHLDVRLRAPARKRSTRGKQAGTGE